jgi:hypothetical protein
MESTDQTILLRCRHGLCTTCYETISAKQTWPSANSANEYDDDGETGDDDSDSSDASFSSSARPDYAFFLHQKNIGRAAHILESRLLMSCSEEDRRCQLCSRHPGSGRLAEHILGRGHFRALVEKGGLPKDPNGPGIWWQVFPARGRNGTDSYIWFNHLTGQIYEEFSRSAVESEGIAGPEFNRSRSRRRIRSV